MDSVRYINNIENKDIIPEITDGKTVAFIAGCYCPPHKGHFKIWQTVCEDLDLDVLCISSLNNPPYKTEEYDRISIEDNNKGKKIQPSYKSRHGIPIDFTEWVVSKWSQQLKNKKGEQVTVIFFSSTPYRLIQNNFKQLYLIIGNEGEGDESSDIYKETTATIIQNNKNDLDKPDISYWGKLKGITNEQLNDSNTYPMWRISYKNYWRDTRKTGDGLSATKFSLCLKNIKKGKHEPSACFNFLPDFMSEKNKQEYIEKIIDNKNGYYTDTAYDECIKFNQNVKKLTDDEEVKMNCEKYDFTPDPDYNSIKKSHSPKSVSRSPSPKSKSRKHKGGSRSPSPKTKKYKGGSRSKSRKRKSGSKTLLRKKTCKKSKRK
jgi:hypothetical protein